MIIDAHTHLMQHGRDFSSELAAYYLTMYDGARSWRTGKAYTVDDWCVPPTTLLADMDSAGVDRAVVMTLGSSVFGGHDPSLALDIGNWCNEFPDRFIGMLTADPLNGAAEARRIADDVRRLGLSGVKLLPAYSRLAIDDGRIDPIYAAVQALDIPLVLHTGWCAIPHGRTLDHDHPLQVETVLSRFPDLRIIVAHCGFAWSEHVLFLLAARPRVYADLAYWSQTMPKWRAAATLSHAKHLGVANRLMWGTDYPFASPLADLTYWRAIPMTSERMGLDPAVSDSDIDSFLGPNAARAFMTTSATIERGDSLT